MTDIERTATDRVTREIVRFLESSKPEVLALRGAWGVGKTYLWNKLLEQTKATIGLKKYAYVSLFGLQNLNELKYSIYENTIDTKDVGIEPSLKTLQTNTDFVVKSFGTQLISVISRFKGASATLEAISFLAVRDRIVCIDDLERRGSNLRIIDVLGLVSYLTERRGCKVVMILNDEALTDTDARPCPLPGEGHRPVAPLCSDRRGERQNCAGQGCTHDASALSTVHFPRRVQYPRHQKD